MIILYSDHMPLAQNQRLHAVGRRKRRILQVTPTRVRALIAQGALPAQKVGRTWTLREDVMQRCATRPSAGRPRKADVPSPADDSKPHAAASEISRMQDHLAACPSAAEIAAIDDPSRPRSASPSPTSSPTQTVGARSPRGLLMSEQPFYVVFAGVNGAGKSTLFRSDFWHTGGMPATMARANPDEILREQGGTGRTARIKWPQAGSFCAAWAWTSGGTTLVQSGNNAGRPSSPAHHGRSTREGIPRVPVLHRPA